MGITTIYHAVQMHISIEAEQVQKIQVNYTRWARLPCLWTERVFTDSSTLTHMYYLVG